MRILLLGATGQIGGRAAAELLRHSEVAHLTLAGRDPAKLSALGDRFDRSGRVDTTLFDIRSRPDLVRAASQNDVVVSCAGPAYELEEISADGALEAGKPYISLNNDLGPAAALAGRSDDALAAKVPVVSGCGATPGLSNLLVAHACVELEDVEEIKIAVGGSSRDSAGRATELHFVSMFDAVAGSPGTDRSAAPQPVYFPEPAGWVETFACGHPEELAFRHITGRAAPVRFRAGLVEKAVMDVVRASVAVGLTRDDPGRRTWLNLTQPLRPLLERLVPRRGGWTALRVDVHGRSGGRTRTVSYGVVDRLVNLASISIAEGAIRMQELDLEGGVLTPDEVFDASAFLRSVSARGIRFARLEPHRL